MNSTSVVARLASLAQDSRLAVFRLLVRHGPAGLAAGEIATKLKIPPATLSFHLKELLHSGMVTQERSGRNLIYRAAFGRMSALIGYLTENCCEGEACAASTAVAPRG